MLLTAFHKEEAIAIEIQNAKEKERQLAEQKKQEALRKRAEEESNSAQITELTDAEADELQKQLDIKSYVN